MASPYWVKTLLKKSFSSRFFLARLTHFPVLGNLIEKALFENDDIIYLAKDSVVEINHDLAGREDMVMPSQVLEHFIIRSNYRFIMNTCICRESEGCRDYPIDLGCIFLGEAALDINPKFGRLASVEETLEHARKCREAGLVHLIGRNKLDTIWLNVRPKEKLLTVCHCCPCCCLWKVIPTITDKISDRVAPMPGLTVAVTDKCVGCGACINDICFVNAIRLVDGKAEISGDCRGCGRCVEICPSEAIRVNFHGGASVEDAINRIHGLVDFT
ncbi:4Fe-4S dicluster domain-containing protein [Desulfatibacillum alkenivorans DSM 16219]|jgi:ferredoxin|uniref:4Fe-4S dicluster domain-containing protein n=1 Tax=Desulfatibacillum alkenivorans DSM 16219 TaxID=1121393 RepID=A0A1M7A8K2_9BACT|nr:4Fe-4S binding protein [Desulfatibacillum alkenivorans]SHL38889.1 4Fe-4S dicluster domain-containing protein [Desulfatibacillum alkenivorans DSM 16219]